jgi:NADH-quinone oxidoreductase subunit B
MAMNPSDPPRAKANPPSADPTAAGAPPPGAGDQMPADQPGHPVDALVVPGTRDVAAPLVVENSLWTSPKAGAYAGGDAQLHHLHLAELEDSPLVRRDDARWGALEAIPTTADTVFDLLRMNSLWPLLSGLACCAMEMMSSATSRNDIDRWGFFPFRASPRQADVLIVAGTLTTKMAGPLIRLWEQMPEPKWCVAMGDCTCSGGRYKRSYSTIEGIDRVMPVDVYVPGCPPRPEGLIYGMMKLQQLVKARRGEWRERRIGPNVPEDV